MATYQITDNGSSVTIDCDGQSNTYEKKGFRFFDEGLRLSIYTPQGITNINTTNIFPFSTNIFIIDLTIDNVVGSSAITGSELRNELLSSFFSAGGSSYVLPTATATTKGGVYFEDDEASSTLTIDDEPIS